MKIKKYTIGILTASLIATSSVSCSDSFESINTDPNETPMGMLNPYGVFEAMFYGYVNRSLAFTRQYNNELVQFTACTGSNGKQQQRIHHLDILRTLCSQRRPYGTARHNKERAGGTGCRSDAQSPYNVESHRPVRRRAIPRGFPARPG